MAEYIKKETAIKSLLNDCLGQVSYSREDAADCIRYMDAADVAPVVRCKNCVHYDLGVCLKIYSDGNAHPEAWQPRRLEDFCSYDERKGEANEP